METVKITIDGQQYEVEKGIPLVLAAERAGVRIPHLCYYEGLSIFAGCRLCVVEIEGMRGLPTSCTTQTADGMVVWTKTPQVLEMQRGVMSLICADHPDRCLSCHRQEHCGIDYICLRDAVVTYRCLTCAKNKRCEFQTTSEEMQMHRYPMRYYQEEHSWYGPNHVQLPVRRNNPFIELDFNECILCARCVRACGEVRGQFCYEMSYKGPKARIDTAFGLPLQDVGCDACGVCIDVCPVASIMDKPSKWKGNAEGTVLTTCPHHAEGCQLEVETKQERVLRVIPSKLGPGNHGVSDARCRYALGFVHDPGRLQRPLIRRDGGFVEASWDEALDLVAERLGACRGPAFGAVTSPRATNEEHYLLQKFTRSVMGSPNIDSYSALDAPAVVDALGESMGYRASTASLDDIGDARCILVVASDTQVTHPLAAWQARSAARFKGAKLIVANPRYNELVKWAGLWLRYRPGTEVPLLGGMMSAVLEEGLAGEEFIASRCEGLDALRESIAGLSAAQASAITGVPEDQIREAARAVAGSGGTAFLYDTGIARYTNNRDGARAIVDLALLTGNVGKPGAGVMALRGASNQQGADDMGCTPSRGPGHRPASEPGLAFNQMIEAAGGSLKAMVLLGADPLADDPDRAGIAAALDRLEFLVSLDSFLTPTALLADVVLPLAVWSEVEGTYTSAERRLQRVRRVFQAPGEARPGWEVINAIATRMGSTEFNRQDPAAVMAEIAAAVPEYRGISYQRLEEAGLQWPCPEAGHPGSGVLYADGFPGGKARFLPISYRPLSEPAGGDYPMLLAAGRDLVPYHYEVLTGREDPTTPGFDAEMLRLHPEDAARLGIADGEVVRLVTRGSGTIEAAAMLTDAVPTGSVFLAVPILYDPAPLQNGRISAALELLPDVSLTAARIERVEVQR